MQMNCDNCEHKGYSGGSEVCGYLLQGGDTCYIHNGSISEPCPKEAWERYNELIE